MNNIYLPNLISSCKVIIDKDTIRSYDSMPTYDSYVNYKDYYINSHYIFKEGTQHFSNYSTLPTCLSESVFTNNVFYRNDLPFILIIFSICFYFWFYMPFKIFMRLFRIRK